jgi:hypothetical protein
MWGDGLGPGLDSEIRRGEGGAHFSVRIESLIRCDLQLA